MPFTRTHLINNYYCSVDFRPSEGIAIFRTKGPNREPLPVIALFVLLVETLGFLVLTYIIFTVIKSSYLFLISLLAIIAIMLVVMYQSYKYVYKRFDYEKVKHNYIDIERTLVIDLEDSTDNKPEDIIAGQADIFVDNIDKLGLLKCDSATTYSKFDGPGEYVENLQKINVQDPPWPTNRELFLSFGFVPVILTEDHKMINIFPSQVFFNPYSNSYLSNYKQYELGSLISAVYDKYPNLLEDHQDLLVFDDGFIGFPFR